jgi:hypothetical protein
VPNKRTRKLTEATAEAVALTEGSERTPLAHMLAILNNPDAPEARKDQMAIAAAPFLHPRLAMTASVDGANGGTVIGVVNVIGVPRGGQWSDGLIVYPDGETCPPLPFEPLTPTPALELSAPDVVDSDPTPPVQLEPEPDDKLTVLDVWRRKKSDSDPSAF